MPGNYPFGAPVSTKKVMAKSEPASLIAEDASTCTVSPDRFQRTGIGDLVRCSWCGGSGAARLLLTNTLGIDTWNLPAWSTSSNRPLPFSPFCEGRITSSS